MVMPQARQQETWAKLPETHWRPVEFRLALAADSRRPQVGHALRNQGPRLKSVSVFQSRAAKRIAPATQPAEHSQQVLLPAPELRSAQPPSVSYLPVPRRSIALRVQSVFSRCLYFYRSTRKRSELWCLRRANRSASFPGFARVAVRKYRLAAQGRLSQRRVRQTKPSTARRRATSKTARAIAPAVGFVPCRPF
jgi:hypothetical protein